MIDQKKEYGLNSKTNKTKKIPMQENYIYGIHAVEELLRTRLQSVDHVYFEKDKRNPALFNLLKFCRKERLSYNLVPGLKLQQVPVQQSIGVSPRSAALSLLYCRRTAKTLLKAKPACNPPGISRRSGNLRSIIRSSVAFGADALLLEKNTAPLNARLPKLCRND